MLLIPVLLFGDDDDDGNDDDNNHSILPVPCFADQKPLVSHRVIGLVAILRRYRSRGFDFLREVLKNQKLLYISSITMAERSLRFSAIAWSQEDHSEDKPAHSANSRRTAEVVLVLQHNHSLAEDTVEHRKRRVKTKSAAAVTFLSGETNKGGIHTGSSSDGDDLPMFACPRSLVKSAMVE